MGPYVEGEYARSHHPNPAAAIYLITSMSCLYLHLYRSIISLHQALKLGSLWTKETPLSAVPASPSEGAGPDSAGRAQGWAGLAGRSGEGKGLKMKNKNVLD